MAVCSGRALTQGVLSTHTKLVYLKGNLTWTSIHWKILCILSKRWWWEFDQSLACETMGEPWSYSIGVKYIDVPNSIP